ncbi:NADH dehydrogenase [ubiquinone] iron-sulfur protein 4, mitochondrial-like [Cimex lectularius]|uniref:NADH dehydrogenase [ubiquinone] iron-sulfur protein 4, mitochondrial n=1 Tax=Cimex lectularius TaxID=79782 RepID=A0A8I6RJL4_CIMLE|nr:NADH dehydrogenase [ubiquinone] iron-sulfur protein 4, mitochondrial-like [Cimex lectularius]
MLKRIALRCIQKRFMSDEPPKTECKEWSEMKEAALELKEAEQAPLEQMETSNEKIEVKQTVNMSHLEQYAEMYSKNSTALIKPVTKIVTQQGTDNTGYWEMSFDTKQRWVNPTMGWCSSGHSFSNISLYFPDRESAVKFAQERGWKYSIDSVVDTKKTKFKVKSYGANFSHNRRTRVSTK